MTHHFGGSRLTAERKLSKRLGYVRVSSFDQNHVRQLEGVTVDKLYTDKCSGKDTNRPALAELLEYAREGDTVVVHSLDRLGRNLDDLRKLVSDLNQRGVSVQFIKEGLMLVGDDSPLSKLLFNVLGSFAEFERSLIRERQREGIALAKKEGKYMGRKPSLTEAQAMELRNRATTESNAALAREFGISRETLYQYIRT